MASVDMQNRVDRFDEFFRTYYEDRIAELAQHYPAERRSLFIEWTDLYRFDEDLAADVRTHPEQLIAEAEEALRVFDLPVDISLGQAHIRIRDIPETTVIREIRAEHVNELIAVRGIVRKATGVKPRIEEAAFECQRCGTMTQVAQTGGQFQEPHECPGCERKGPFRLDESESTFVDAQTIRVQESPEGLRGGQTPENIDVHIEDDITGDISPGDHVKATGILRLEQQQTGGEQSTVFDVYMEGSSVEAEEEQFEEMEITEEDEEWIIEQSDRDDIYDRMVDSIAPSIYGYEKAKLAMTLQLFSGVTKNLPDGSRTRGDMHLLLIGDPGVGKCLKYDTMIHMSDGTARPIGEIVEEKLTEPKPVDDGFYDETSFSVPSIETNGKVTQREVTRVWKRETPETLLQVTTQRGREITITPTHPLFVQEDGQLVAKTGFELEEGEFLAAPTVVEPIADDRLDVSYRKSKSPNAVRLQLPDRWTPQLARLLGYIVAEGYVQLGEDHTGDIRITNNDREVLDDVACCLDRLGLPWTESDVRPNKSAREIRCSSGEFASFLENLEPAILKRSAEQRVPNPIFSTREVVRAAFLRGYIEGEGSVSNKQRAVTISSMSRELLVDIRRLLLSLGIESQLHVKKGGSWRLRLSGSYFERYLRKVGFVTDRKTEQAHSYDQTPENTNLEVIPEVSEFLEEIRTTLRLSQFDCGVPRTTYQHYERGDRNPSRDSLRKVVAAFEERIDELKRMAERLSKDGWWGIEPTRQEIDVSQAKLAKRCGVSQGGISYYERNKLVPDGGVIFEAGGLLAEEIHTALSAEHKVERLRELVEAEVSWDRIESIEVVEPEDEWVYDLEVEGTHNYIAEGLVSHNSALLQYVRNIAPRSVYTSGKGSSAAGLCVTGDTLIQTSNGLVPIEEVVSDVLPEPVSIETSVEKEIEVDTFDRRSGEMTSLSSSHVWRMPPKPCRRIETRYGKEIEASHNTPVLVCDDVGIEWQPIAEVEAGDHVAVPKFGNVNREPARVQNFLELTTEKLDLDEKSVSFLRESLGNKYGTLREAAAALDLSEDFISLHVKNRHVPIDKLDRMLDAVGRERDDISFRRAMIRHGDSITVPELFDDDLMYLIGLVFGDGDISLNRRGENRGCIRISNGEEEVLERAAEIFEQKFGKRPEIEYQEDKVPCIRVNSATIARLFSNVGMCTPKDDLALAPELTTAAHADAFLRGLMDADGSVSVRDSGGSSVLLSTISESLAKQVQLILETYGVRASVRDRDRRGEYELPDGQVIESKRIQYFVEIFGADTDRYAEVIGFRCPAKQAALETITGTERREEMLPVGGALSTANGPSDQYHVNINRGCNPGRSRAKAMLEDIDLGPAEEIVREAVEAELAWDEVVAAVDTGEKEVFDLTVPETHNFVGNGIITHNTAAAVRDDFGDGQQWSLEAGALVLADQGVAAIDELDKMAPDDRSALHEGLEAQEISISKAGINATLKARCSLLGAANPRYGRFDPYEPIGEQIDLEPALISRFDLIFTVTDQPDPDEDRELASHILETNYAGELTTRRDQLHADDVTDEQIEAVSGTVTPAIDPDRFRKYVAFAQQSCFPRMTDEARQAIEDFYVDLRSKGSDQDAPVPVTARKLEALVRLAEASARIRLADEVELRDAERVIELVRSCLQDIGVDPETGEYDADVVETGRSKTQRDRIRGLKEIIEELQGQYDEGAPREEVLDRAEAAGMDRAKAEDQIQMLRDRGEVIAPSGERLRRV